MVTEPEMVDFALCPGFISPHWVSLVVTVEFHEQLSRNLCQGENQNELAQCLLTILISMRLMSNFLILC